MMQQAREHEADDKRRRELIEVRNTADTLAYQTERALRDLGDKVPQNERQNIQGKLDELRETMKRRKPRRHPPPDGGACKTPFHALSQQLYAQQQTARRRAIPAGKRQPEGNGRSGNGSGEGEVIEGEFREA